MMDLVVVGAGILGLSTAFAVAENLDRQYNMTIIADSFPDDEEYSSQYTSPWAGAHFRPAPSKNEAELRDYKFTRVTQDKFRIISNTNPESSIRFIKGIDFVEDPSEGYITLEKSYTDSLNEFEVLKKEEVPEGVEFGAKYETWVVNPDIYLKYLQKKLKSEYDVKFMKVRLKSLSEVNEYVSNYPIIFNCSGKGLMFNGGYDSNIFSIRGQTLLVNAPKNCPFSQLTITHQSRDGKWTFVIPRPLNGGYILGGTKQLDDTYDKPREEDTKQLLERGEKYFPELMKETHSGKKYFDIIRINVGFRPASKVGLVLNIDRSNKNLVINNYGAGGLGYELSYGSGLRAYELLLEYLQSKVKL